MMDGKKGYQRRGERVSRRAFLKTAGVGSPRHSEPTRTPIALASVFSETAQK